MLLSHMTLPVLVVECVFVVSWEDWLHTGCNRDVPSSWSKVSDSNYTYSNTHTHTIITPRWTQWQLRLSSLTVVELGREEGER